MTKYREIAKCYDRLDSLQRVLDKCKQDSTGGRIDVTVTFRPGIKESCSFDLFAHHKELQKWIEQQMENTRREIRELEDEQH